MSLLADLLGGLIELLLTWPLEWLSRRDPPPRIRSDRGDVPGRDLS
jgi:hypothetical protein